MTRSMTSGYTMHWYAVRAVIGRDRREKSLAVLEEALRTAAWPDARSVTTGPAPGGGALVTVTLKARHCGDAACKALEFIRQSAPREWDWTNASVEAERYPEGVKRWPWLAVDPQAGEHKSAEMAKTLADAVNVHGAGSVEELTELLEMTGLKRRKS